MLRRSQGVVFMIRLILAAILAAQALLVFEAPAFANECEDAAQRVRRDARDAKLAPELAAQVDLALEKALATRKSGDKMGCLSGVEAARKLFQGK
jgi:hypothetical protein